MKKRIGIVCGGYSGEAAVSMKSAAMLLKNIDREKYEPFHMIIEKGNWHVVIDEKKIPIDTKDFSFDFEGNRLRPDICLVIVHGTPGEDGLLQGYFDMIDMPYTTGSVLNLALTFNKRFTNDVLSERGFHTAKGVLVHSPDKFQESEILEKLKLPVFVKPNQGGSSLGISKVSRAEDLRAAVEKAYRENSAILIEEFLDGREFTCGVICGKENYQALAVTEITTEREFFDYEAKYSLDQTKEITPAELPEDLYETCRSTSESIARSFECKGVIRIDYKLVGDIFHVIEINTVPGMTETSLVPQQAAAIGIGKTELINLMIESAGNQ
ncbi:MAG TPA: D-alanine--D-alanine ligase family protein [Cryomorphaceae bacterium]|nr:D-alanine--D-alanine ligase family protein [Cryomorphaceae bacterium]